MTVYIWKTDVKAYDVKWWGGNTDIQNKKASLYFYSAIFF